MQFLSQQHIRTEKGYETVNGNFIASKENIHQFIEDNPEKFSPNVMIRPLFQEVILPNICFIGGSAEISYWLEQKPLFDYYNIPFPMLAHRPIVVPLRKNQLQKIEKLGLRFESLFEDKNEVIKNWISKNAANELSVEKEKSEIAKTFDSLADKAKAIDKTLESSIKSELQKAINGLENIQVKMTKAEKRNQEISVQQINSVFESVFPNETLYERTENSLAFHSKLTKDNFEAFVNMMESSYESLIFIEIE